MRFGFRAGASGPGASGIYELFMQYDLIFGLNIMEPRLEKTLSSGVSDQVGLKLACSATEAS